MSRVCLLSLAVLLACARAYSDPTGKPAGMTAEANAVTLVTGELGNTLHLPCLESEDPTLYVFWYRGHGKGKLLKNDAVYGMRRNALLIRSLAIDTLGPYACQAYNSKDMKPLRIFVVRAYMPDGTSPPDSDWLLPRSTGAPSPGTQPPTSLETSTAITMTSTEASELNDELEVTAFVGGKAILRSEFNAQDESWMETNTSQPKILWDFGDIQIDGNSGRYRLLSDGALEIVSLYRNDTGVYTFTALNKFRLFTQKIHLVVNDSVRMPAGIAGDENAVVTGELGSPLEVRCLAYGFPPPCVFWYSGFGEEAIVLYNDTNYETIRNVLTIKSLNQDTLGEYTCGAYNGVGPVALWKLIVRSNMPEEPLVTVNDFTQPGAQPSTTMETTTTGLLSNETSTAGELTEITQETTEASESETSTRRSTNKGTIDVIGTTTLDPCISFEFGCCADNETEAKGSEVEGCPETETSTTGVPTETKNDTTKSIVANEGSTTSAGTSDVIDTTTLDPCSSFEFGCCVDNETEASGPDGQGCPCNATEFDCRPDGVSLETSTAGGLTKATENTTEASEVETSTPSTTNKDTTDAIGTTTMDPCSSFEFGCCADNESEATGSEKEGCPETETSTTRAHTESTNETTESIVANEGSTISEGTTDVTGTTTLDPCGSFEFGCCADNETEASGPDGQGCPCNATEFGCCPDGVSPAVGRESEGCPVPCSKSPYGCCQDEKSPAHGRDFEGCCLLQAFGCCPDNRKPAKGANFEGCGCQDALHGCCPDNVTIAQGPHNQGCDCQYTKYGCCPNRHTAASGPNNEGCTCNTYQFGCCADGVSTATGPEQQDCHCRESKFGCCGDGETPATGPDGAGCDCSCSRYGCCPDGRTEATGPKFLGCTDAPENKQAACSMLMDRGPCQNFTVMWYYDLGYGGCSRFWYRGCDGNGNRFSTKDECEDVCVQPSPKDACKLPMVKGACDAYYRHWHYSSRTEQCVPFRYGGCLGNANNFETEELCQKQCDRSSLTDQCNLPFDQGSCAGNYSRWGFNSESHRCEQFIWGGCEGNFNRFSSEAACQMRCAQNKQPQCALPREPGNCTTKEALWSFSKSENRCVPFYYSGCGGNDNRFSSRETCEQNCPSAYVPDKCTLPAENGQCSNYRERWFYDTTLQRCREFYYGGCGGNENNFGTEAECENSCSEIKTTTTTTTTTTTASPVEPQPEPRPHVTDQRPAAPDRSDICQLPMLQGPCDDSLMRWFYDPTTDSCSQFTYGGCDGNNNRFESLEACENRCRTGPAPVAPTSPTTTVIVDGASGCKVPEALEVCHYGGVVWFFDPSSHECVSHANQEAGSVCRHTGTFSSQEACERSCGVFQGIDVCKELLDAGPCRSSVTKVYFDASTGQCHEFIYGGCLGGANRFSSIEECSKVCKSEIADPCTLPADGGSCNSYILQWCYDPPRDQCSQFVYTGCSGNENRFETQRDCEARCSKRPAANTTTAATPPLQLAESECKTPSSLAPCGYNVTVFYHDSERRQCLVSGIGGCGHPNSYSTEEECERSCGAFRGLDEQNVPAAPLALPQPKPEVLASEGGSATLHCLFHGNPPPKITWKFGELAIDGNAGRYRLLPDGALEIVSLYRNDTGVYTCVADNGLGVAKQAIHLVVNGINEVDCDKHVINCSRLRCEYGVQRARLPEGCEKCSCVQLELDCEPQRQECNLIQCNYGVERIRGADGCERCDCLKYPCNRQSCGAGERCVVQQYVDPFEPETKFAAECRTIVKAGACPMDEMTTNEVTCRQECRDDADCRGVGKCCQRACSYLCVIPVEQTSPHPLLTTTVAPNVPAAPLALPQPKPEVAVSEGSLATLRCLFHGNPPLKITWRIGELPIDGNAGRYRLLPDGALEIVSLYRNDTGVYTCLADNSFGVATQEIRLVVNDPVRIPTGIAGDENGTVTGELGSPLEVRCLAYGYPPPSVFWYRGHNGPMVPYNNAMYLARGNILLIRSLTIETLGQYTCQAYNGEGKAASWVVFVRAYQPEEYFIENESIVPRNTLPPRLRTQPPSTAETTTTTITPTTEAFSLWFTVPVSTHVSTPYSTLNSGADLRLKCDVDGFPEPVVYWTKDGVTIRMDGRITITDSIIVSRLTVLRVSVADSGLYTCHASNQYSSQSDTAQIEVQQIVIPAKCTDNAFFANCNLIVRSKFCTHSYYGHFCCKSCVEAGQLDPQEAAL